MFTNGTRPKVLPGVTYKIGTDCGSLYIVINADENKKPIEVFARMGKTGGCVASQIEGLSRLISVALQNGVEATELIHHLKGIRCPAPQVSTDNVTITSCSDAFAKALERFVTGKNEEENGKPECPHCNGKMGKKENELKCEECGFVKAD